MPMGGGAAGGMDMSAYPMAFISAVAVLVGLAVVIVVARHARMMLDSRRDRDRALVRDRRLPRSAWRCSRPRATLRKAPSDSIRR